MFPEHVVGLILKSIWFSRKEETNWLYQEGISKFYPEGWKEYLKPIPEQKRNDIVRAYYEIFTNGEDSEQNEAVRAWNSWEANISKLISSTGFVNSFDDSYDAISTAKLKCYYFANNMFAETDNYILDNAHKIFGIPTVIINGRYDLGCPGYTAREFHRVLPKSKFIEEKDAGYSENGRGMIDKLVKATEDFKKLY